MPTVSHDGDGLEPRLWEHPAPITLHVSIMEADRSGTDSELRGGSDDLRHGRPATVTRRVSITGRNLFVEGIPATVDDGELHALFERFGAIESARILRHPKSGRPRGVGFVYFETEDSAARALEAVNGMTHELFGFGMGISVKLANKEAAFIPEMSNKIFLRNLPFAVTPPRLIEFYSQFGKVIGCSIHKDVSALSRRQTAQMNMAYVTFDEIDEAVAALKATHRTQPFTAELTGLDHVHRQLLLEVKAAESLQCRNQRLHHQPTGGEVEEADHHEPDRQRKHTTPIHKGKGSDLHHAARPSQLDPVDLSRSLESTATILLPQAPANKSLSASSASSVHGITPSMSCSGSVPPHMTSPMETPFPNSASSPPAPWTPFPLVMPIAPQFLFPPAHFQAPMPIVVLPPHSEGRPLAPSWNTQIPMVQTLAPPPQPPQMGYVWMMPMRYQ